jgi:hypothetical protein
MRAGTGSLMPGGEGDLSYRCRAKGDRFRSKLAATIPFVAMAAPFVAMAAPFVAMAASTAGARSA